MHRFRDSALAASSLSLSLSAGINEAARIREIDRAIATLGLHNIVRIDFEFQRSPVDEVAIEPPVALYSARRPPAKNL